MDQFFNLNQNFFTNEMEQKNANNNKNPTQRSRRFLVYGKCVVQSMLKDVYVIKSPTAENKFALLEFEYQNSDLIQQFKTKLDVIQERVLIQIDQDGRIVTPKFRLANQTSTILYYLTESSNY